LKPGTVIRLGQSFGLSDAAITMAVTQLEKNLESAIEAVNMLDIDNLEFRNAFIKLMRKKWNGIFALIGKNLSKKR